MLSDQVLDFRDPLPDAALYNRGYAALPKVLGAMGFSGLRPGGQDQIVHTLLAGVDSICILPTSGGKSACFVIPALCHGWRLLVFSPLKALMADQVRSLNDKGIAAVALTSDQPDNVNRRNLGDWQDGACKIMFVAPERLQNDDFMRVMRQAPPDMVAIDEVHTLSAWTDNFRHHFVYIGDLIEQFKPRLVAGFTATYSKEIDADVRRVLRIPKARLLAFYPRRENLILSSTWLERDDPFMVARRLREVKGPGLVYCNSRARVMEWAADLSDKLGEIVGFYHAEITPSVKKEQQANFFSGRTRIMVATNAFGMGIDKPDIRSVIHVDCPADPEALSQETGRAGRDGQDSFCHAFYTPKALSMCERRIKDGNPTSGTIRHYYDYLKRMADRAGIIDLDTGKALKDLGLSEYAYYPLVQLFSGAGIFIEAEGYSRDHRLGFVPGKSCESKAFAKLQEAMEKLGRPDPEDPTLLLFNKDFLCQELQLSAATVAKNLNGWKADGTIKYIAPGRTKPKRLVGDLSLIDFERMEAKRKLAFKKLDVVTKYMESDDSEKHGILEEYFTKFFRES